MGFWVVLRWNCQENHQNSLKVWTFYSNLIQRRVTFPPASSPIFMGLLWNLHSSIQKMPPSQSPWPFSRFSPTIRHVTRCYQNKCAIRFVSAQMVIWQGWGSTVLKLTTRFSTYFWPDKDRQNSKVPNDRTQRKDLGGGGVISPAELASIIVRYATDLRNTTIHHFWRWWERKGTVFLGRLLYIFAGDLWEWFTGEGKYRQLSWFHFFRKRKGEAGTGF